MSILCYRDTGPLLAAGPGYAEIILIVTFSQQQTLTSGSSFAGTSGVTGDRHVTLHSWLLAAVSREQSLASQRH